MNATDKEMNEAIDELCDEYYDCFGDCYKDTMKSLGAILAGGGVGLDGIMELSIHKKVRSGFRSKEQWQSLGNTIFKKYGGLLSTAVRGGIAGAALASIYTTAHGSKKCNMFK